jgi:hypothetical protein
VVVWCAFTAPKIHWTHKRIFGKKAKKGGKRKRKEATDQVEDLVDFLIGSYMTSGESKRELAGHEEAITGINPLSHPDRQLETAADLLPWPRGRAVRLRLAELSLIIIIKKLLH